MPTEVIMPKVDMDMETGTIAAWHADDGDFVDKGSALFDIETDKAAMEVEAPASGRLRIITTGVDVSIAIGTPVAWILAEGEAAPAQVAEQTKPESGTPVSAAADSNPQPRFGAALASEVPSPSSGVRATPLARRLCRAHAIDLSKIIGSGPRGRITKTDVEAFLSDAKAQVTAVETGKETTASAAIETERPHMRIPVDRMRATIAARLTESKTTIPHFYLDADCRLDALLAFRRETNAVLAGGAHTRISLNDLLIKACALALRDVPTANASWAGDTIIRYQTADISFAVAIEGGLVTPVIRDVAARTISDISREASELAEQARTGKLAPEAYKGGSFSISNLGMFGVKSFSAIINPPQSMILAVGEARKTFVPDDDDQPVAATILSVTLSCDHRVVDGAIGAEWLQSFKTYVENPLALIV